MSVVPPKRRNPELPRRLSGISFSSGISFPSGGQIGGSVRRSIRLSGNSQCRNRAENDFAIVRASARVVPLRAVNGRLRTPTMSTGHFVGLRLLSAFLEPKERTSLSTRSCSRARSTVGPYRALARVSLSMRSMIQTAGNSFQARSWTTPCRAPTMFRPSFSQPITCLRRPTHWALRVRLMAVSAQT